MLLEFLNIGGMEMVLILFIFLPFTLTIYCLINIIKSNFKDGNTKILFALLVLLAPFVGSIIYLFLRKNYINSKNSFNQFS